MVLFCWWFGYFLVDDFLLIFWYVGFVCGNFGFRFWVFWLLVVVCLFFVVVVGLYFAGDFL